MDQAARWRRRAVAIAVWIATVVAAFGVGAAGLTKFVQPAHWQPLFAGWGYPVWFASIVGAAEVGGALCLLVPRLASYAAVLLSLVMAGALVTLLLHPGGPLGWGATPAFYLVLLTAIGVLRRRDRIGAVRAGA